MGRSWRIVVLSTIASVCLASECEVPAVEQLKPDCKIEAVVIVGNYEITSMCFVNATFTENVMIDCDGLGKPVNVVSGKPTSICETITVTSIGTTTL